jgi:hypothetical protein
LTRIDFETNNLTIHEWRERGPKGREWGSAGGEELKSHTVMEVLAKNFVPETSIPILVVSEVLGGGWEEKAAVGMACSLPSTVLRIAQTAEDKIVRCNGTARLHKKSDTSITLCAVPQHVILS